MRRILLIALSLVAVMCFTGCEDFSVQGLMSSMGFSNEQNPETRMEYYKSDANKAHESYMSNLALTGISTVPENGTIYLVKSEEFYISYEYVGETELSTDKNPSDLSKTDEYENNEGYTLVTDSALLDGVPDNVKIYVP